MTQRNTATRDRHRAIIRRGKPPCGICGQPIDYTLPHLDPGEYTVDHIEPLGQDPSPERVAELDVIENKQAAHRKCNRDKWHRESGADARTWVTHREW